jgi:hypothetical protein
MAAVIRQAIAVLRRPTRVKYVITFAQSVATAMTGNAFFPSPTPPLATFEADIAALLSAEAVVLGGAKGATETRDIKLRAVKYDLEHLRAYVQQVADADPSTAEAVIQSAGMSVKRVGSRSKDALAAKPGKVSGSVELVARAASHRASYEWQYSTDQKVWNNAPSTLSANTEVTGLVAGTTYFFRVRPVTKAGEGDYTQVVSLIVQ